MNLIDIDVISGDVVDCAMSIHRDLGLGLLDSVYEIVFAAAPARRGYSFARQYGVAIHYGGFDFPAAFRVDLLVEGRLVVELKSVENLNAAHSKQLLTYLWLLKQPVALLLNFSGATIKEGLKWIVNGHNGRC